MIQQLLLLFSTSIHLFIHTGHAQQPLPINSNVPILDESIDSTSPTNPTGNENVVDPILSNAFGVPESQTTVRATFEDVQTGLNAATTASASLVDNLVQKHLALQQRHDAETLALEKTMNASKAVIEEVMEPNAATGGVEEIL